MKLEEDATLAIAVARARSLSASSEEGLILDGSTLIEQLVSSSSAGITQQAITINVFVIGMDGASPRLAASGDLVEAFVESGIVVAVSPRGIIQFISDVPRFIYYGFKEQSRLAHSMAISTRTLIYFVRIFRFVF